jgi:hypothetical protein
MSAAQYTSPAAISGAQLRCTIPTSAPAGCSITSMSCSSLTEGAFVAGGDAGSEKNSGNGGPFENCGVGGRDYHASDAGGSNPTLAQCIAYCHSCAACVGFAYNGGSSCYMNGGYSAQPAAFTTIDPGGGWRQCVASPALLCSARAHTRVTSEHVLCQYIAQLYDQRVCGHVRDATHVHRWLCRGCHCRPLRCRQHNICRRWW